MTVIFIKKEIFYKKPIFYFDLSIKDEDKDWDHEEIEYKILPLIYVENMNFIQEKLINLSL
jgi:hypothetical protein